MLDDERQLKKRFEELGTRAERRGRSCSEFLTPAEQETLRRAGLSAPFSLEGGYPDAERRVAVFGDCRDEPPILCLRIAPAAQKFADELSHRDFLGALMNLGVRREVLGDIVISDNCGYLFCLDSIADFILRELTLVKRTTVRTEITAAPPLSAAQPPEESLVVVASERLDALIAAVYKLSRSESQGLFAQGRVFVNSRATENTSLIPAPGSVVSVRGSGRFLYEGTEAETRKGRLRVRVRIY
ncbi:MAG: YlmH/Sll1252 family protein, partial [Oscillospiraceae bacterium]